MKKILLLALLCAFAAAPSQAQIGSALRNAASKTIKKTADKLMDKTTDKASDEASNAIGNALGLNRRSSSGVNLNGAPTATDPSMELASLLSGAASNVPTVKDVVDYKGYELNGQNLKMLTSPVSRYFGLIASNALKASNLLSQEADSAAIMQQAMQYASLSTGLSQEEIAALAEMSEEEQEAYLMAHYNSDRAQNLRLNVAETSSQYMKETEKQMEAYYAAEDEIAAVYSAANAEMEAVYQKFAERLASAKSDSQRIPVLLQYYTEAAPIQMRAAQQAMDIRQAKELPLAKEIDEINRGILKEHPDAVVVTNFEALTITQYFNDAHSIIDIPLF